MVLGVLPRMDAAEIHVLLGRGFVVPVETFDQHVLRLVFQEMSLILILRVVKWTAMHTQ